MSSVTPWQGPDTEHSVKNRLQGHPVREMPQIALVVQLVVNRATACKSPLYLPARLKNRAPVLLCQDLLCT